VSWRAALKVDVNLERHDLQGRVWAVVHRRTEHRKDWIFNRLSLVDGQGDSTLAKTG